MKRLLLIVAIGMMAGCEATGGEGAPVPDSVVPDGLKDCKFFHLESGTGNHYTVVRCPNSSTSVTRPGKHPEHTMTIDNGTASADADLIAMQEKTTAEQKKLITIATIDAEIARLEIEKSRLK